MLSRARSRRQPLSAEQRRAGASRLAVLGLTTMMLVLPSFAFWSVYTSYRTSALAINVSTTHATSAADRSDTRQTLERQSATQVRLLIATPVVFLFGMGFVLLFWRVLRSNRAEVVRVLQREASAGWDREQRFRALVQNTSDLLLICGEDGSITFQTPSAHTDWGFAEDGLCGQSFATLVHPDDQAALCGIWEKLRQSAGLTKSCDVRMHDATHQWRHTQLILTNLLRESGVCGIVATVRDVTERKRFEEQLVHQAFHDVLTGLPNRALLHDRIAHALQRAARRETMVGLLFIDLDNFKLVNDSLGHHVGDQLLVEAAARIQSCIRSEDLVARLGGDEFVVLLENLTADEDAVLTSKRISQAFARPFQFAGQAPVVNTSIGIALGRPGQDTADTLLCNADSAMYRAKSNGKGCHVVFEALMHDDGVARLTLESDLRHALTHGDEMVLHYQPIQRLSTGDITEIEALVRWRHPTRGLIPPAEFIPIAEQTGLIVPLGQWVLEEACRQTMIWQQLHAVENPLILSVNLSPRQFRQSALLDGIEQALVGSGLSPRHLKLEITEGMMVRDVDATIVTLQGLKQLGVQIAVDDFGTGYSSLAYLKKLPLDVLKIDRAFVNGIGESVEDTAIVRAILALAHALNLSVTAEGIETAEQAGLLRSWGCESGQGYYFSKPVAAAEITALLLRGQTAWVPSVPPNHDISPLGDPLACDHPEWVRRRLQSEMATGNDW